jgi:uncharacterized protein
MIPNPSAIHSTCASTIAPYERPAGTPGVNCPALPVQVWERRTSGVDRGAEAAAWAPEVLSRERPGRYHLVRMADSTHRRSKIGDGELAYGDAYPFLVISGESLADLNRRMPVPLPMNRFRRGLRTRTIVR